MSTVAEMKDSAFDNIWSLTSVSVSFRRIRKVHLQINFLFR